MLAPPTFRTVAIGNNRLMTGKPPQTRYHRWLGWYAPAMRRALVAGGIGLSAAVVLVQFVSWEFALIGSWDAAALAFLVSVWLIVLRADATNTQQLSTREDETRGSAAVLLVGASVASLVGVGLALVFAERESGLARTLLVGLAIITVVLSWTVVNTIYTLRYADLHYRSHAGGFGFDDAREQARPNYRDFAYVAFTIGMTYQVSDTAVRDPRIRRTVLSHALLAYVFGVVIVASTVNLIAGLA
jgi:uncharacterized membrane protein